MTRATPSQLISTLLLNDHMLDCGAPAEEPDYWNIFRSLIQRHDIFSLICERLLHSSTIPVPVFERRNLENQLLAQHLRNKQLSEECFRVAAHFNKHGQILLPYKGPHLSTQLFGSALRRDSLDLDFFFPGSLKEVQQYMGALGYAPDSPRNIPQAPYRFFQGQWSFFHPHKRIHLEIHWRLVERHFAPRAPTARELLNFLSPSQEHKTPLPQLTLPMLLVLLSVHACKHRHEKLKWLLDLRYIQAQCTPEQLEQSREIARQFGLENFLREAICFTEQVFSSKSELCNFLERNQENKLSLSQKFKHDMALLPSFQDRVLSSCLLLTGINERDIEASGLKNEYLALMYRPFRLCRLFLERQISWCGLQAFRQEFLNVWRLWAELHQKQAGRLYLALGTSLLLSLLEGGFLLAFLPLVLPPTDSSSASLSILSWIRPLANIQSIPSPSFLIPIVGALWAMIFSLLSYAGRIIQGDLQECYANSLRKDLIHSWSSAKWSTIAQIAPDEMLHQVSQEVDRIGYLVGLLLKASSTVLTLALFSTLAFLLSPWLITSTGLIAALLFLFVLGKSRRFKTLGEEQLKSSQVLFERGAETLVAGKWLHGSKLASSAEKELTLLSDANTQINQALLRVSAGQDLFTSICSTLIFILTLTIGSHLFTLSALELGLLFCIAARLYPKVSELLFSISTIRSLLPSFTMAVHRRSHFATQTSQPTPPPLLSNVLTEFKNVSFSYKDSDILFSDLSLQLEHGESVFITGPSGAGKSTFLDLILGLQLPTAGQICSNLSRFAFLSQETFLFSGSLHHNLCILTQSEVEKREIEEVLRLTGLTKLATTLPDGLDTRVGAGGVSLSGGERQRIALARALLSKPEVLLMDESTNALDEESEAEIFEQLVHWKSAPTLLLVSHRKHLSQYCKRHLHIEQGEVTFLNWHEAGQLYAIS